VGRYSFTVRLSHPQHLAGFAGALASHVLHHSKPEWCKRWSFAIALLWLGARFPHVVRARHPHIAAYRVNFEGKLVMKASFPRPAPWRCEPPITRQW